MTKASADRVSRREFNRAAAATALAAAATLAAPATLRAQTPPNLVVIIQDDQNAYSSAVDGYPLVKNGAPFNCTPNATRLANMGVRCTNAFAASPYCSSSRTSFLFGLHPHDTGIYSRNMDWAVNSTVSPSVLGGTPPQKMLPRFLKDQGYETIGIGKVTHRGWYDKETGKKRGRIDPGAWTHFEDCRVGDCVAPPQREDDEGFPSYSVGDDYPLISDAIRAKWAVDNVLSVAHEKPFALFFGISNPHTPLDAAAEFYNALSPEQGVLEIPYPMGVRVEDQRVDLTKSNSWDLKDEPTTARGPMLDQFSTEDSIKIINSGQWKTYIRAYLAEMMASDRTLGQILDGIAAGPNASNTYIILISDHGWMLGEKLGWRKFTLWDTALKVPFVIAGPGIPAGVTMTNPIGLLDLFPIVCDLLFQQVPTKADLGKFPLRGQSRASWFTGDPTAYRYNQVLSQWRLVTKENDVIGGNPTNAHLSIRDNNLRFIQYDGGDRALYAHSGPGNDPNEWFNLWGPRMSATSRAYGDELAKSLPDKSRFAPIALDLTEPDPDA